MHRFKSKFRSWTGLSAISCIVALSLGGCVPGVMGPIANAGNDQNVQTGQNVSLNGSNSTGTAPLQFQWTQSSGTNVTLNNANTSAPSFTAPNQVGALVFTLTVTDGSGQSNSDNVTVNVMAGGNQAPTANAGADQSVNGGEAVQLDGSGSSDPDNDPLTFAWTQTAGSSVALSGETTANPTFTAPLSTETLTFQLTVSDGNGGADTDSVNVTVTSQPRLFIANFAGNSVVSYANPDTVNGNIPPDTNLQGAQTLLNAPSDIVINAAGQLHVSNFNTPSVTTYNNAANTNGNLQPNGNVTGAATQLFQPTTLTVNTAEDLLFVADITGNNILVFDNTSSSAFNGNRAPTRVINSVDINNPFGINFGANDDLYVANNTTGAIAVFANASNLNGNVAATRLITSGSFNNIFDVFIDGNDTMFVVDATGGNVFIFSNAASLNGAVTPDFTLQVIPATTLTAIAVDSNDVGYLVDNVNNAVYSYNNISTRNGPFNPNRTIQGNQTQLVAPIRVFLTE